MKTIKNLFGKNENQKSVNNFNSVLDISCMIKIKGGDATPINDDLWPPKAGTGGN